MGTNVLTRSSEDIYIKELSRLKGELTDELLSNYEALKDELITNAVEKKDEFIDFILGDTVRNYKHFATNVSVLSRLIDEIALGTIYDNLSKLREEGLKMFTFVKFMQKTNENLTTVYKELIVEPLIKSVGAFIISSVKKDFKVSIIPFAERVALATEGVLKASWRYEPDSGYRFTTYCAQWIRASINNAINGYTALKINGQRKNKFFMLGGKYHQFCKETGSCDLREFINWLKGKGEDVPFTYEELEELFTAIQPHSSIESIFSFEDSENRTSDDYLDSSVVSGIGDSYHSNPESLVEQSDYLAKLHNVLDRVLTKDEKDVFIKVALEGIRQSRLAEQLGVSRQRINSLYKSALIKLRSIFPDKESLFSLNPSI